MFGRQKVTCEICGMMKYLGEECKACKEIFQLPETNRPAPIVVPQVPQVQMPPVQQIPIPQQIPQPILDPYANAKPMKEYVLKLDNGSYLEVMMYSATKIVAYLRDEGGITISIETFADVKSFQTAVEQLKQAIAEEIKKIEECKSLFEELGFEEIDVDHDNDNLEEQMELDLK